MKRNCKLCKKQIEVEGILRPGTRNTSATKQLYSQEGVFHGSWYCNWCWASIIDGVNWNV